MPNNIAGVGKRIAGGFIDCFLALIFLMLLGIPFGDTYAGGGAHGNFTIGVNGPSCLVGCIIIVVVFIFLEFKYGKTPGKFVCKIRVVSEATGASITLKQSVMRNLLRFIDGIFLYLVGLIIIMIDKNHQRLGDLVAKTLVIDETKPI